MSCVEVVTLTNAWSALVADEDDSLLLDTVWLVTVVVTVGGLPVRPPIPNSLAAQDVTVSQIPPHQSGLRTSTRCMQTERSGREASGTAG